LEKTQVVYESTKEVVHKISNPTVLGNYVYFEGDEYGGVKNAPKMHAKIVVDIYKDANQKTIKLDYKDQVSQKSKSGLVNKKQLYAFLKKNITILKEGGFRPPTTKGLQKPFQQDIEQVTTLSTLSAKLSETNLEVGFRPLTTKGLPQQLKDLRDSNLFIPISKERRIAYQSCKQIPGKFDYLLDELKNENK
jgi:hypothetical protein